MRYSTMRGCRTSRQLRPENEEYGRLKGREANFC